jgi:molybdenum cofactor cytidylyltransferase
LKFGSLPLEEAEGGIAVHSVRVPDLVVRKGNIVGKAEIDVLRRAGVNEIIVAKLEPGDIPEDEAAASLAKAIAGDGVRIEDAFTGRANLFAEAAGVLQIDRAAVNRLNRVDEAVTFATLPEYKSVQEGEMIGTVKIIPFAISRDVHAAVLAAAGNMIRVMPFSVKRVGVVSTLLPGLARKVIDKTVSITEDRLKPAGTTICSEQRVPHETAALKKAIEDAITEKSELVIVFGASAIADRRDVIPAAIEAAGGRIEHFGMPVDPGNLMLIGSVGGVPVIGAPGCARSPKENGFDWLLTRLLAKLPVKREDITELGVGGLLMEIVTRPQPREATPEEESAARFAAVVLAAGKGTRMGGPNKLLEPLHGKPLLLHAVDAALKSNARPVIVVTGHEHERVAAALKGLEVQIVRNADYSAGLSGSLRAGIEALPEDVKAAAVLLGDMPQVSAKLINMLGASIDPARGALIAVPVRAGRRGNPVVWSRRLFSDISSIEGDTGARHLIAQYKDAVLEIAVDDEGAFVDVDTPEALRAAQMKKRA